MPGVAFKRSHGRPTNLRVSRDSHRLIQFLEILLLFLAQFLASRCQRFVHPFYTREANDWACNALVDPRQRNMAHLPVVLFGKLLDTSNDLLVAIRVA